METVEYLEEDRLCMMSSYCAATPSCRIHIGKCISFTWKLFYIAQGGWCTFISFQTGELQKVVSIWRPITIAGRYSDIQMFYTQLIMSCHQIAHSSICLCILSCITSATHTHTCTLLVLHRYLHPEAPQQQNTGHGATDPHTTCACNAQTKRIRKQKERQWEKMSSNCPT